MSRLRGFVHSVNRLFKLTLNIVNALKLCIFIVGIDFGNDSVLFAVNENLADKLIVGKFLFNCFRRNIFTV